MPSILHKLSPVFNKIFKKLSSEPKLRKIVSVKSGKTDVFEDGITIESWEYELEDVVAIKGIHTVRSAKLTGSSSVLEGDVYFLFKHSDLPRKLIADKDTISDDDGTYKVGYVTELKDTAYSVSCKGA